MTDIERMKVIAEAETRGRREALRELADQFERGDYEGRSRSEIADTLMRWADAEVRTTLFYEQDSEEN